MDLSTSAHMGAHTSLGSQTSAHASLRAHTSAHMNFGAHTRVHMSSGANTSARMCAFLPPGANFSKSGDQVIKGNLWEVYLWHLTNYAWRLYLKT